MIQTAFLGDAVLTLPMLQELKKQKPSCQIFVLCIPSTKEVFENSQSVSEVIVYDKRGSQRSFISYLNLIAQVRSLNFTVVYSPHRSIRSTIISFFSGAKSTVGFDNAGLAMLYKKQITYDKDMHETARNLHLLGIGKNDGWRKILPKMEIDSEVICKVSGMIKCFTTKKIIAVAPGSIWKTKIYPKEYYKIIIDKLTFSGFNIVLIGGKEDSALCESLAVNSENALSLAGKLNIKESVALLKNCTALVCNDSAPTHLAMIADIPVLTIYCSTIAGFGFYPYNKKSRYLSFDDLSCKPCGIHGHNECPIKTFDCAHKLVPELVFEKLKEIITA